MIASQLCSEWMRRRGRPVEKYTGAVVIVLGVLSPIVMLFVSSRNAGMRAAALETLAFPASVRAVRTMAMLLGPLCAAALGANIVGAEHQYGTWPLLLVRTSSRARVVMVKIVTVTARIIGLMIVGILTFVVVGAVACTVFGAPSIGGATTTGLFSSIRFKETAAWIPYVHLENLQSRLLNGGPTPSLMRLYEFDMSARASAGILVCELLVILGVAYVVFRRQEIVY
jgi:ABC-type transport system involved in multi-copper enzyme maturation permease subunit